MFDNLKKYSIVLASNSPRRRELLSQLGIDFTVRALSDIDESYPAELEKEAIAFHIVGKKSEAYRATMAANEMIITADTIVYVDGEVLGKPVNADDARRMLRLLSGKTHDVITAVGITTAAASSRFAVTTQVKFATLTDAIIDYYITNFQPFDKAGSYGIQEWIGYVGVESVTGSFFNVIGLPIQRLFTELQNY